MTTTIVRQHARKYHSPALNPGAPFSDDIARRIASKRLQAQRSERANTPPVVKLETVGSAYAGVWKTLAKAIGLEVRV